MRFDPDRFLDERVQTYLVANPFIFLPFNAGRASASDSRYVPLRAGPARSQYVRPAHGRRDVRVARHRQFAYNEVSFMLVRLLQRFASVRLRQDAHPAAVPPPGAETSPYAVDGREREQIYKSLLTLNHYVCLYPELYSDADEGEHGRAAGEPAVLQLSDGSTLEGLLRSPAAAIDLRDVPNEDGPTVLARYPSKEEDKAFAAGIKVSIGHGVAVFWSVHLEYSPREEIAASILAKEASFTPDILKEAEEGRIRILRETLANLGLTLPSQPSNVARPTPQVLTAAAWRSGVIRRILQSLNVPDLDGVGDKGHELKDSNDTFILHPAIAASRVLGEPHAARYTNEDPETWNPKHIVVFGEGEMPPREFVPRFDLRTYYAALEKARQEQRCPESYPDLGWGMGEALLYGDVVTSTQTMLDKNMRLLSTLPTPLLSLASSQLTGRGRGGNIWLSPPGCLQFSILLRVPLSALPAQKIVFVQYLFALAVAEACRDHAVLGADGARVRIKWPNDIYAEMPGTGERKKVGGILVNTSFGAGNVELVVGNVF
ncbi:hypothetical protein NUW54_g9159 [Trametes sanguinea]|uniref:Uncharacterized protein n=1 Tax=Trametes sanguinea TaxID=158606 RepID=A0ACC1PAQ0_9APHY|nr:hypothetical protein NUW54_g9159 [Trametes sanguinea]